MVEPAGVERTKGVGVVALCGESLLLEGIEASMQDRDSVEIVRLNTSRPGAVQVLDKLSPDIIVFDLTPGQLITVFSFLRNHPDVVLIGLDLARDQALFVAGEWRTLPTVEGLMQVIEAHVRTKVTSGADGSRTSA